MSIFKMILCTSVVWGAYCFNDDNNGDGFDADDGRTGFLMSNNYSYLSSQQDSFNFNLTSLKTDGMYFTLTYWVTTQSSNSDAYLHVSAQNKSKKGLSCTQDYYTNLNLTPVRTTFSVIANEVIMTIFGGKAVSTGALVSFAIKRNGDIIPGDVIECPTYPTNPPLIQTTTAGVGGIAVFVALMTVFGSM